MLPFEKQAVRESNAADSLVVYAKGLGIERLFCSFLKLYCEPPREFFVLVLNTTEEDRTYFADYLLADGIPSDFLPKTIDSDVSIAERTRVYSNEGVLFITSRILVVDLLTNRLPARRVGGVLIYRAHRTIDSHQEAFALRLFREKNTDAFIRAFSDSPLPFTKGLLKLQRSMKSMFLRELVLRPRNHEGIVADLSARQPAVFEIAVQLTPAMKLIQTSLVELIQTCVREIQKLNPEIEFEDISFDGVLGKWFDFEVKRLLEPIWNQLGTKTKQLLEELRTLRDLLETLERSDAGVFYRRIVDIRRSSQANVAHAPDWLFTNTAQKIFSLARQRVVDKTESTESDAPPPELIRVEPTPKWFALESALVEIREQLRAPTYVGSKNVLVVAADDATCTELHEITHGGVESYTRNLERVLLEVAPQYELPARVNAEDTEFFQESVTKTIAPPVTETKAKASKKRRGRGRESAAKSRKETDEAQVTLTQLARGETGPSAREDGAVLASLSSQLDELNVAFLRAYDTYGLLRALETLQPAFVVMYSPNLGVVRQIEATNATARVRVYFLMYENSTEEQRYLLTRKKEDEAFGALIREKANLVIPTEYEVVREAPPSVQLAASGRNAGGQASAETERPKIIVDMREFRSQLPSLIHQRGFDVLPITLEVGDYVLTPDVCVERKSVSDLVSSLNSGRLFTQATAMCRHYKRPMLLIEFDSKRPFSLDGRREFSSYSSQDVRSKLVLFTLHFPLMRVIWSESPEATAQIFEDIKWKKPEPDAEKAATIGDELLRGDSATSSSSTFSPLAQDLLLKVPGVTFKNVHRVLAGGGNIATLAASSKDDLATLFDGLAVAERVHTFFHEEHFKKGTVATSKVRGGATARRRRGAPRGGGGITRYLKPTVPEETASVDISDADSCDSIL